MKIDNEGMASLSRRKRRLLELSDRRAHVYDIAEQLFALDKRIRHRQSELDNPTAVDIEHLASQGQSVEYAQGALSTHRTRLLKVAEVVAPAVIEHLLELPEYREEL